eukprot:4255885-Pleurochrysis_carterae.AAC.2
MLPFNCDRPATCHTVRHWLRSTPSTRQTRPSLKVSYTTLSRYFHAGVNYDPRPPGKQPYLPRGFEDRI